MTDTHFESLIKAAADAQAAREGEAYKAAQAELGQIDTDILAKQLRRDQIVATLDAFDQAIEDAQDAVKVHVATHYIADAVVEEDGLFEGEKPFGFIESPEQAARFRIEGNEFESAKANGALTE